MVSRSFTEILHLATLNREAEALILPRLPQPFDLHDARTSNRAIREMPGRSLAHVNLCNKHCKRKDTRILEWHLGD